MHKGEGPYCGSFLSTCGGSKAGTGRLHLQHTVSIAFAAHTARSRRSQDAGGKFHHAGRCGIAAGACGAAVTRQSEVVLVHCMMGDGCWCCRTGPAAPAAQDSHIIKIVAVLAAWPRFCSGGSFLRPAPCVRTCCCFLAPVRCGGRRRCPAARSRPGSAACRGRQRPAQQTLSTAFSGALPRARTRCVLVCGRAARRQCLCPAATCSRGGAQNVTCVWGLQQTSPHTLLARSLACLLAGGITPHAG